MERQAENDRLLKKTFLTAKETERYFELNELLFEFYKLFEYGEDKDERAIAIVGASFLDTILEHILFAFLIDEEKEVRKLLQFDGALGTFSSRITMTYCLGLIPKVIRDDLRLIAKIRNRFAHELRTSFSDETIQSWCLSLKWHRISYATPPDDATTRDLFQVGVNCLITYLNGIVGIARNQRRNKRTFSGE